MEQGMHLALSNLSPEERIQFFHQQSLCCIIAFEALLEYIDEKWNGLQVESTPDDEFVVVEVLNNQVGEKKKKDKKTSKEKEQTTEGIAENETEHILNRRNKTGLSHGR